MKKNKLDIIRSSYETKITKYGLAFKDKYGYWQVITKIYNNKQKFPKYKPLHRLVWEDYHNQPIPEEMIIHHIDKNKDNNNPNNLMCMTQSEHVILHNTKKSKKST